MKGQVAASAVAFASLVREGFAPVGRPALRSRSPTRRSGARTVSGSPGSCRSTRMPCAATTPLNEGGGERLVLGGRAGLPVRDGGEDVGAVHASACAGAAAMRRCPAIADNALVKAARYVEALGALRAAARAHPRGARVPRGRARRGAAARGGARAGRRAASARCPRSSEPLLSLTLSPTMIEASRQRNVIPALARSGVDCRLLPEQTPRRREPLIRAALGEGDYELEWNERAGGTRRRSRRRSGTRWRASRPEIEPGARLAPIVCPGFTDSH